MAAFGIAREAEFFHSSQKVALSKHAAKMVDGGLLPQSALAALEGANPNAVVHHSSGIPTTLRSRPQSEFVYNHVKSLFPSEPSSSSSLWSLQHTFVAAASAADTFDHGKAHRRRHPW